MNSFKTELYRNIDAGQTPREATTTTIKWALEQSIDDLASYVDQFVLRDASEYKRTQDRRVEDAAFIATLDGQLSTPSSTRPAREQFLGNPPEAKGPQVAPWKKLAETRFKLPDGTEVQWQSATAEQHTLRALWQRTRAEKFHSSCIVDAVRHEKAAALIAEHGVSNLHDLPSEEWRYLVEQPDAFNDDDNI